MSDIALDGSHLSEEEVRLEKLHKLRENGTNPFAYMYERTHTLPQFKDEYGHLTHDDNCEDIVRLAGRLMAKRGHGKAAFGNLEDENGAAQYYANINILGDDKYHELLSFDVGDIIGITGSPFLSQKGELTLRVTEFVLLTKTLHPLPEKFHGLQDKETRYRQRYIDLIMNKDVRKTFQHRSQLIFALRNFLHSKGFMEVDTPILQSLYGGAAARPFITHHNELGQNLYLRIATELHLKRLIVGGYEKVYEIGRIFRNEGVSFKHNPEFTSIELYQAYADYYTMMELTESVFSHLVETIHNSTEITYQGTQISFQTPFQRMTMDEALKKYAGVNTTDGESKLREKAAATGLENAKIASIGQLIIHLFDECVEHQLIQPTFILDYPWETSPLAKRKRDNNDLVERFELFINGMELANAFSELNDPIDQHERFLDQIKAHEAGDLEAHQMDDDFVTALKYGMPPTGGLGIGIDRLVMLLTDNASIRDVLFFPHMKTIHTLAAPH